MAHTYPVAVKISKTLHKHFAGKGGIVGPDSSVPGFVSAWASFCSDLKAVFFFLMKGTWIFF